MDELSRARVRRIGIAIALAGLPMWPMAVGVRSYEPLIALAVLVAFGAALFFQLAAARWLAAAACALVAVVAVGSTVLDIVGGELADDGAALVLLVANALATTALAAWSCACAAFALVGRPLGGVRPTARLVGAFLVVLAAAHLRRATDLAIDDAGYNFSLSLDGIALQFPGWPLWHATAAVVGVALLFGPRRVAAHASTALVALAAVLIAMPLVAVRDDLAVALFGAALFVSPAYLAWWLRDELRRAPD